MQSTYIRQSIQMKKKSSSAQTNEPVLPSWKKQTNNKYSAIWKSTKCYMCEILKHSKIVCDCYGKSPWQNMNSLVAHLKKHRCQIHQIRHSKYGKWLYWITVECQKPNNAEIQMISCSNSWLFRFRLFGSFFSVRISDKLS